MGLLGGVGYGGYNYYLWSEQTIATLRENNVKLKTAAETLQNTVEQMAADQKRNEELNKQLTQRLQASQEHLNKLRDKFAKIDLTMEALKDANGLEARVDRAVDRLIEKIETETTPPGSGSPAATDSVRDVPQSGKGSSPTN